MLSFNCSSQPPVSRNLPQPNMEPVRLSSFVCAKPRPKSLQSPTRDGLPPRPGKTPRAPVAPHRMALQAVIENVDLLVLIAEQTTDTGTLLHLLEACETGRQVVKQMPVSMITALLDLLPLEIRQMAVAILALESIKLNDSAERETFVNTYLGHSDEPLPILSHPVKAFFQVRDIVAAVSTFEPLYVDLCKRNLDKIQTLTLATVPPYFPYQYRDVSRPSWRCDGENLTEISSEFEGDPSGEQANLRHRTAKPNPFRLPTHPIETYRIKRSFWRFELFCRLFPEVPTMETGNEVELNQDKKVYLARLQEWECEEVSSIIPFLFRLLERIYDPAVFRNQATHLKRSQLQWNSFLSQAPAEETVRFKGEPSAQLHAEYWRKKISFASCVGEEWDECPRLDFPGLEGMMVGERATKLSQQKWLAHQVSRGLGHIFACHQQFIHDEGKVFPKHYPIQRYEPSQFYKAPAEAFLRWHYMPYGEIEIEDCRPGKAVAKHSRQWSDMPEAHVPGACWSWISREHWFAANDRLHLVNTGYIFWCSKNQDEDS